MAVINFKPHSQKQYDVVTSNAELTIAGTGTQWGKSLSGSYWMVKQLHTFTHPDDNFLIMAPTYKIGAQSMLPPFIDLMTRLKFGHYKKVDACFDLHDGRHIYFRTETDPDSIVGIPRVKAYWLDEAGKTGLYFHENIQARAASVGARGLYTTSPYSRNWLYRDYIKPKQGNHLALPNIKLVQAASWENPYHSLHNETKRIEMQGQMDPRRFEMLFGGEWGKQAGLVYDCFSDSENVIAPHRLPNGTVFYGGVDWGHTEPFVIVVRAVTPDGMHYQVSEFYKTGLTIIDQVKIARQKAQVFGIKHFYCGHERPENIMIFNQNGLPSTGVPEPKSIQAGTDLHYELIKLRRYKVFEGSSPYTLDEYETYHYPEPENLDPDDDAEDQAPVGQTDHCMSANRFVTLNTYRSNLVRTPYTPEETGTRPRAETQEQRLRRLMRSKTRTKMRTESWS